MKKAFVETENVARFLDALAGLQKRGADEANLMVVDGEPGLGKSTTMEWWATQHGLPFLRACKEWTPAWFLSDLLGELGVAPQRSVERRYKQALAELTQRRGHADLQKQVFALVLDEADHVSRSGAIMETIRDLSDNGDIPVILVGMGRLRDNLTRFPQIASRISRYARFEQASRDDVRRMLDALCDYPVDEMLTDFVHRVTLGRNREIKEAIRAIEAFGRRNGAGAQRPVRLADLAGQTLINDRRTGQPIAVPGGL
ncbi:AAA family ATPase [Methylocystis sp. S23]